MVGSPNSLGSLSSPSPSPSPPPSASKSTHAEPNAALDSDSELSELTEEDQEAEKQKRKQASNSRRSRLINGRGASGSRPSRRGGRRKRGSIVPQAMWGWAEAKALSDDGGDNDRGKVVGPKGILVDLEGAMDEGGSKTPATFITSPKNLPNTQTSQSHTSAAAAEGSSSHTIQSIVERQLAVDVPINPLDVLTTAAAEVVKSVEAPAGDDETESESEEPQAIQPSEEVSAAETDSDAEDGPAAAIAADELEEDGDAARTKPGRTSTSSIASSRSTPISSRSPSPTAPLEAAVTILGTAKAQVEEDEIEEEEVDDVAAPDILDDSATVPTKTKPKSKSKPHMAIAIPEPEIDLDVDQNPDIDMEVEIEVEADVDIKEDDIEDEKEDEKEVDDEDKEDDVDDVKEEEEEEKEEEEEEEEEEIELPPAHRIEALDVLATIELKFALLREKLYVEKMEELAWEESLVADGTHPELIHLHGELSRRKDKRLELATKKRAFEVANLHKRRKLDEDGTWSWWKLARDELQTEMIAETNRKRRRLERDRRAVERPQPVRRIPQPPTELLLSPPTLRKVIKADPFNIKPQHTKREDRVSKRNGLAGHFSTAIDRPSSLAYPELATLNSSDVRSDLDLLASFKRPAQPPPAQPMFDGHPIGHGLPNRINTPNAMIPPSMPPNMYDHPYGAPPPPMNDNFAPFGAPGGRSIVSQSNMHPQGLSPYANAPSLGPGPGMGQGGRPGSSAGPSSAGPSRPYHIHRPPSPIMSNQPALGHGAHGSSPFTQAGMGPIEREQEMLLHSRPSSSFNDGGQPQGPPPGYGRRSPSPSGSMHAGSSLGRVHGMGYDDRVPVKVNFRDEREREALLNSKDPEIQHALMNSKDPEVRQFMADRDRNMSMHAEAEYMSRLNRSSKDEVLDRHFPPNGPYRDQDIMMDRVMDRDMRQSFGPTSEREKERLRREEMYKHNVPHHYRQPNHHHHHHKPHHHHVVHHHHVRQSSNATPASTSPRQANLSPRMSRGEPAENGVYNRALPPQGHPPPPPSHPTEAINLSSKGPPPSSVPWKGEDVQGRDYRDSRKINSRPPSGPPLLPGDERERDRHIPVPFAMGSSQPSSAVHSNGPSSTSSPRPAWNTTDHDDNYRSGTHPPPPGSPGHRFASSTSQMHPLGRNGSHVPAGSSGPQSPPRSRAYRPPSPSIVPPGPTRSPTRYRERSSPPMNHSKIIRPGSPSLPVPGRPASATSPPAPSSGPPPIDVMKNGTKPSSPDVTRSNGSGVLISSTPRLIGTHIEKSALSPRLSSNTSPPKMSVPQIVDSHS